MVAAWRWYAQVNFDSESCLTMQEKATKERGRVNSQQARNRLDNRWGLYSAEEEGASGGKRGGPPG